MSINNIEGESLEVLSQNIDGGKYSFGRSITDNFWQYTLNLTDIYVNKKVGVGDFALSNPTAEFHIKGSTNATMKIEADTLFTSKVNLSNGAAYWEIVNNVAGQLDIIRTGNSKVTLEGGSNVLKTKNTLGNTLTVETGANQESNIKFVNGGSTWSVGQSSTDQLQIKDNDSLKIYVEKNTGRMHTIDVDLDVLRIAAADFAPQKWNIHQDNTTTDLLTNYDITKVLTYESNGNITAEGAVKATTNFTLKGPGANWKLENLTGALDITRGSTSSLRVYDGANPKTVTKNFVANNGTLTLNDGTDNETTSDASIHITTTNNDPKNILIDNSSGYFDMANDSVGTITKVQNDNDMYLNFDPVNDTLELGGNGYTSTKIINSSAFTYIQKGSGLGLGITLTDNSQVGIGTVVSNPGTRFEVHSGGIGALKLPLLTTVQRDAIVSPEYGMICYNTSTDQLNAYMGGIVDGWKVIGTF